MELVGRPTGFLWGYFYVGLGLLNSVPNIWVIIDAFREGAVAMGLGIGVILLILWASLYGIARRRRWGLILTSILLGLMMVLALLQLWMAFFGERRATMLPGFLPLSVVLPGVQLFYGLFFFVYFLRRRKLFA